ncbi:MAG: hypothetical protein AAF998_10175 [Bacteroidota bacterium]
MGIPIFIERSFVGLGTREKFYGIVDIVSFVGGNRLDKAFGYRKPLARIDRSVIGNQPIFKLTLLDDDFNAGIAPVFEQGFNLIFAGDETTSQVFKIDQE